MQNSRQQIEILNTRRLLFIHFLLCSIGLLAVIETIAKVVGTAIFAPINVFISYTDWAVYSSTPNKPVELLQYGLSVPILACYYALIPFIVRKCHVLVDEILGKLAPSKVVLIAYFIFVLLFNMATLRTRSMFAPIAMLIWFFVLTLPLLPLVNTWVDYICKKNSRWLARGILLTLITSLGFVFYPYIAGKMPVSNDYMDIPEQTILSSGLVDNTEYINKNKIAGLHKHDPRNIGVGETSIKADAFISLKNTPRLLQFISVHQKILAYDEFNKSLVVVGTLNEKDADSLARVVADDVERSRVYGFYYSQLSESKNRVIYTAEQIEFIRKNAHEMRDQSLAGHYFHHQNTMLGTINEYVLGKPQHQTVFLYGWLSTVVIAEAMKAFNDINFEGYQKVFYSFYPAYYLLLLFAAALIFKRIGYVLLVGTIAISSLYFVGFEMIRFAPGFNPIRHFFDIFALVCFYCYLFKPNRKLLYFVLTVFFSVIGIFFNKEFGVALFLSMAATMLARAVIEKKKSIPEFFFIAVAILFTLFMLLQIPTGKNPTLLYVLLGVAAPTIHWIKMYALLFLFIAIYIVLIKNKKSDNNWRYLFLFWFLYVQGLLIYYVWNPAPNHIWSLGSVWGMALVLLLQYANSNYDWVAKHEKKILVVSNTLVVFFLFLPSAVSYYQDKVAFHKIFDEHTVYQWDFPRVKFESTMDPAVFKNSVELINKYSVGNSIYILSKYDNFLPFLSGKYSAMPYTEMALSLVTQKEIDISINLIRNKKPEFLFVDTDILKNHQGDITKEDDPATKYLGTYDASKGRAMVLDNFSKVFQSISPLYEKVEVGQLITVYKRRSGT